ncbi:MAG TPA: type II secretion system F family protein [Oligoflexia bacterium]|nr:type II secretion system F family protein [Oligoflexia bacterium]HMP27484.1 type II secretion system F family protein [Oligoflexia bacterium]
MITTVNIILVICLLLTVIAFVFFSIYFFENRIPLFRDRHFKSQLKNLVLAQRGVSQEAEKERSKLAQKIFSTGNISEQTKILSSELTLPKLLKYGCWRMPPAIFRLSELLISLVAFVIAQTYFNIVIQGLSLLVGPLFMRWLLNLSVDRRFKAFDSDYSPFLLSLIGLLKTGMNSIQAIEAAASGLEETSLVRQQVELMIERLRLGVSEERSIGNFGEDIYHPEIELFVQALLLSKRVGGSLSDTLERLAKQVRRRQYFRHSAVAAVGMQRGSIVIIILILLALQVYLYFVYPEAVIGTFKNPFGFEIWQTSVAVILLAVYWIRQVTKIKV